MCGICERIQMIRDGCNPYFVKELETGYVVIGDHQHFEGYTLFLYREHALELFDLEPAVRVRHLVEMTVVAEAVRNAFGAEKMNYECLGNGIDSAHIHWHLFPEGSETSGPAATTAGAPYGAIPWSGCMPTAPGPTGKNWKK